MSTGGFQHRAQANLSGEYWHLLEVTEEMLARESTPIRMGIFCVFTYMTRSIGPSVLFCADYMLLSDVYTFALELRYK